MRSIEPCIVACCREAIERVDVCPQRLGRGCVGCNRRDAGMRRGTRVLGTVEQLFVQLLAMPQSSDLNGSGDPGRARQPVARPNRGCALGNPMSRTYVSRERANQVASITNPAASGIVMKYRDASGSVIVTSSPFFSCHSRLSSSEPRLPSTFPNRTEAIVVRRSTERPQLARQAVCSCQAPTWVVPPCR